MTATDTKMDVKEKAGYRRLMLLLLLGCNYVIVAINHTLPTFQGYTPHYFCELDNGSATVEGCVQTDEPSCPQGYQFESERGDWTIVTEWQLICERRAFKPLLATIYFCGVTLGAVICGMLADRYGRRPTVFICLYVEGILSIALYFVSSVEAFMGIRFAQGFFVQGVQGVSFTLAVELFPMRLRTAVGVVLELYWAAGLVYLAAASYCIPHWRTLQLVLCVPTAVSWFIVCIIPESPRWLAARGRHREAQKVWNRILPHNKNKFAREMQSIRENLLQNEIKGIGSSATNNTQSAIENGTQSNINNSEISKCTGCAVNNLDIKEEKEHNDDIVLEEIPSKRSSGVEDSVSHDGIDSAPKNILQKLCGTDEANGASSSPGSSTRDSGIRDSTQSISNSSEISNNSRTDILNDQKAQTDNELVLVPVNDECKNGNQSDKRGQEISREMDKIICENKITSGSNLTVQSLEISSVASDVVTSGSNNEVEIVQNPNPHQTKRAGILELFKNGVLRKYNLIMVCVWFSVTLSYYGILFYLPDLSGERHLSFALGAILEAVSYIIAYFILTRFGRRRPMAAYLLITGIICIAVGAASVLPQEDASWIGYTQTALALIGKATAVSAFCTMFIYTSELFPTILRAAAVGHCGFWARVGSLLAPQLLFLGEFTLTAVPLLIMGILGILSGLLIFALPETLGQQLPDTVEEAQALAKKNQHV